MLNGFEKYTYDLSPVEINRIIPFLVTLLNKQEKGKKHAITNQQIQKELKKFYLLENIDKEVREARIRKYIFYIRYHGLVPDLIANSKGYYKASTNEEVDNWLDSITGRIEALQLIYKSISNGRKLQLLKFKSSYRQIPCDIIITSDLRVICIIKIGKKTRIRAVMKLTQGDVFNYKWGVMMAKRKAYLRFWCKVVKKLCRELNEAISNKELSRKEYKGKLLLQYPGMMKYEVKEEIEKYLEETNIKINGGLKL